MRQIQFLTVDELKDGSPIQTNLDEKVLNQCILEFQELELVDILGKPLYQRLSNELVNGATIEDYEYSDEDSELFEKIRPVMLYGALLYSIAPLHYKITNKGIQKLSDNNATTSDRTDIEALKSSYTFKLDRYKRFLTDYLLKEQVDDESMRTASRADTTMSFTGIHIPDNEIDEEQLLNDIAYKRISVIPGRRGGYYGW